MGLTSAMLVGFSGIRSNQYAIDTIGDNVANVNTTAFKNQRAQFETVFYRTLAEGTAPEGTYGGTNPQEVGYGSQLAALQRSFEQGSIEGTGVKSDVAIDGDGFLVLTTATEEQAYTRDGALRLNQNNVLVTADGSFVQGFAADANGDIVTGTLSNLTIPLGSESDAEATATAVVDGNLDAEATVASTGAVATSAPLVTANGTASGNTALTALVDDDGTALFSTSDVVTIQSVQKGGVDLPEAQFVVGTDGTTLSDFASFLQGITGIDTSIAGTGQTPGVTVDGTGALVITSNPGEPNALSIEASNIRNSTTGRLPFTFTSTSAAGEGVTTSFDVFDSLGNTVNVRLRATLESRDDSGALWRFYVESIDHPGGNPLLGTGTISFDQNGQFVSATGTEVTIDRSGAGAVSPLSFSLDLSNVTGLNFGDGESSLVMDTQDGVPGGTLVDYEIDADGVMVGTFSNGITRNFGQLALATFRNNEGLQARGDNMFVVGVNSGDATIGAPNVQGAGSIRSGALELSNVDLSRQFVNLITASTGFSAASRVVRSADDLMQELLLLAR